MVILHKAQEKLAVSDARFKVWRAGRRTGKTVYMSEEAKAAAVYIDGGRVLYLATTKVHARKIAWDIFKAAFRSARPQVSDSRMELRVTNNHGTESLVTVSGWETRESFRGDSYDLILIDETDSLVDFARDFDDLIRPLILDRKGKVIFIGTPKDSNPNMQYLKERYGDRDGWEFFHASSRENPHLDPKLIDQEEEDLTEQSFRQEWLAEYGDGSTKLFDPAAVNDMFHITLPADRDRTPYIICDPASSDVNKTSAETLDHTAFGRWQGMEVWLDESQGLSSDGIIERLLSDERNYSIPRKNIMIDGIGIGDSIADRAPIVGLTVFKSSFSPIKTDVDISKSLPGTVEPKPTLSEFRNLRTQCYFALAKVINTRQIRVHCTEEQAEKIKRELSATVEMENERLRLLIPKSDIKRIIGHSPDMSDILAMRMFYEIQRNERTAGGNYGIPIKKRRFMKMKKIVRRGK